MTKRLHRPAPPQPAAAVPTAAPANDGPQQQAAPQMVQLPPLPGEAFQAVAALIDLGRKALPLTSQNMDTVSYVTRWLEQAQAIEAPAPAAAPSPQPEA